MLRTASTAAGAADRPRAVSEPAVGDEDGRRRLIVVCGPGGTGKTTLADALSRALDVACLHKDAVKTALHDVGIVTDRSFEIFRTFVEQQLANRIDLIVEATLHRPEHVDLLQTWQQAYGLDLVCVICQVDRDERRRRIETRDRHVAHAEADQQQLRDLDDEVDYSRLPGFHIDVTTDDDPAVTARTVLEQLRRAAGGPVERARRLRVLDEDVRGQDTAH